MARTTDFSSCTAKCLRVRKAAVAGRRDYQSSWTTKRVVMTVAVASQFALFSPLAVCVAQLELVLITSADIGLAFVQLRKIRPKVLQPEGDFQNVRKVIGIDLSPWLAGRWQGVLEKLLCQH